MLQANQNLSRRAALKGVALAVSAAAVSTATVAALADTAADPIFAAIEAHRVADAAFWNAVRELDDLRSRLPHDVTRKLRCRSSSI